MSKEKAIKEFYDKEYYGQVHSVEEDISRHYSRVAKKIGIRGNESVLDVACGTGNWLGVLEASGCQCSGIDLSERAIAAAKKRLPEARLCSGSAEFLPFEDDQFDLVSCLGSLEHFINREQCLEEMQRVAKPGAQFLFLVPNKDFLTRKLGFYAGTEQATIYEEVLSLEEWEECFENSGFRVKSCWKDLHILSRVWIFQRGFLRFPARFIQALLLGVWPLRWQYQVYYLCHV